jgi:hypothetical protein
MKTPLKIHDELSNAQELYGTDVVVEAMCITPEMAASWLEANNHNRPTRRSHIEYLSREMAQGNWMFNGEAIKIAEDESVLDGQHRLMACIESGIDFHTMVVYGLDPAAFKTIDTGVQRSASDATILHHPEMPRAVARDCAAAAKWTNRIRCGMTTKAAYAKLSNTEVLEMLAKHPEILQCVTNIRGFGVPANQRPVNLGAAAAFYFVVSKAGWEKATTFMRDLFVGDGIERDSPAYQVRAYIIEDQAKRYRSNSAVRMMTIMKAWNLTMRGRPAKTLQSITLKGDESCPVLLLSASGSRM